MHRVFQKDISISDELSASYPYLTDEYQQQFYGPYYHYYQQEASDPVQVWFFKASF